MDSDTQESLRYWKAHKYQYHHIPFVDAVRSLSSKKPLVEIKPATRPNEWMVYYVGTSNPAVMTYAGIFSEAEPYDTGNLVWGNNTPPPDLEESRITHFAGFKASYSFALETYHDQEIWQLQRDIEEYVVNNVSGFNIGRVPRLEWQNGHITMMRFFMRVPMFFPHATRGPQPKAPEGLHPWVRAAHAKSRSHRANPRPPKVRAIEDGTLKPIAECARKKLEYGDVVGIVFTLSFAVTPSNLSPVYMLSDVIRVMTANRETFPAPVESEAGDPPAYNDDFSITNVPNPSVLTTLQEPPNSPNTTAASSTLSPPVPTVSGGTSSSAGPEHSPPPAYDTPDADTTPQPVADDRIVVGAANHPNRGDVEDDDESSTTDSTRGSTGTSARDEHAADAPATTSARYVTRHPLSDDRSDDRVETESSSTRGGAKPRKPLVQPKSRRAGAVARGSGYDT